MSSTHTDAARDRKKYIAARRAQRRLQVAFENIDWEYDVLLPELEALEKNATERLELPAITLEYED